jgi:multidrug efflux pump subunit AcrA (membrane-fusion protein)
MNHLTKILSISSLLFAGISCNTEETTEPITTDIVDAVFASGYTLMENEYLVTASAEGYLVDTKVKEGDSVKKGAPLFELSNEIEREQLLNAQINYEDAKQDLQPDAPQQAKLRLQIEQAQHQLELDELSLNRYNKLVKTGAVSKAEYERMHSQYEQSRRQVAIHQKSLHDLIEQLQLKLKNAETQLRIEQEQFGDYYLSSSIEGVVLQVLKEPGELVRRGEAIAKIGGGKPMIRLFVAEEDINHIQLGQPVAVALNTDRNQIRQARISSIHPAFDEQEQSFICEAEFSRMESIYANTQLQANIIIDQKKNALVIPREYLLEGDLVITDDGEPVAVNIGIRNDEWVEVLSGLEGKERIRKQKPI